MRGITARGKDTAQVWGPNLNMTGVQSFTLAALATAGVTPFMYTDEAGVKQPVPVLAIYVTASVFLRFTTAGGDAASFNDISLYAGQQNLVAQPANITEAHFLKFTSTPGADVTVIPCQY